MAVVIAGIIGVLFCMLLMHSLIFWLLLGRKIPLVRAFAVTSVMIALNRLLVPASGYAVMGWQLKQGSVPLRASVPAFFLMEFCAVIPWIIAGVFFGAGIGVQFPVIFLAGAAVCAGFFIFKRSRIKEYCRQFMLYVRETRLVFAAVIPLAAVNFLLGMVYYVLLVRLIPVTLSLEQIAKIFSIAFTAGYLSPVPGGLGIKEISAAALLAAQGTPLKDAARLLVADRVIMTGFYITAGLACGAEIIIAALKARFGKSRKSFGNNDFA
jgi:uncharacterized membrane protein YbhN (UPF0104 family)